ncbi:MAG: hypothetical protein ACLFRJ_01155 [Ectothiorhodospira sp.]
MPARTRIILLSVIALATIVFLQPLLTFIGGLVVLAVVVTFIYRDLPQDTQDMIEDYLGHWLQKSRDGFWPGSAHHRDLEPDPEPESAPTREKTASKPRTRRTSRTPRSKGGTGNGGNGNGKGGALSKDD